MRMTEADAIAHATRHGLPLDATLTLPARHKQEVMARPALQLDRYKSKTERLYAQRLDVLRHEGVILRWDYEPLKLRLADACFYTPDFLVLFAANPDNLELHEVKGFWRDDARVKIKVAASQFPYFQFRAVRYVDGDWRYENFRSTP